MTATVLTEPDIVRRYAEDVAVAAEAEQTTDLDSFIGQLDTAVRNLKMAGINGHEDLELASTLLGEARHADSEEARGSFLKRADELLTPIYDMASEYSCI
jgi:hypothetical protein